MHYVVEFDDTFFFHNHFDDVASENRVVIELKDDSAGRRAGCNNLAHRFFPILRFQEHLTLDRVMAKLLNDTHIRHPGEKTYRFLSLVTTKRIPIDQSRAIDGPMQGARHVF